MQQPVILVFDIGKTNKKILLFNLHYKLLHESTITLPEITDEDGFACEDVVALTRWIQQEFDSISANKNYEIKAINFSAYGASFVNLDENYKPITALYNYLKPYPEKLLQQFYETYGGEEAFAKETASPVLGSLNSGMQLYRLKYEKPQVFERIKYALHLPQYISFIISNLVAADITSVGCHTNLWSFETNSYHYWVYKEGLHVKFPPVYNGDKVFTITKNNKQIITGIGLHDSSAALIPYFAAFEEPFVLISTGTWCISMNPFNHVPLTKDELHKDCLCYLTYTGKPVKSSRLFAGYEHEQQLKRIAAHFNKAADYYQAVCFNNFLVNYEAGYISFSETDLNNFATYEEAYHQLIACIVKQQKQSTQLVIQQSPVKNIFVDGGFSKNEIYMRMLAAAFAGANVFAATAAQATGLGAALAIHEKWNNIAYPNNFIELKKYTGM